MKYFSNSSLKNPEYWEDCNPRTIIPHDRHIVSLHCLTQHIPSICARSGVSDITGWESAKHDIKMHLCRRRTRSVLEHIWFACHRDVITDIIKMIVGILLVSSWCSLSHGSCHFTAQIHVPGWDVLYLHVIMWWQYTRKPAQQHSTSRLSSSLPWPFSLRSGTVDWPQVVSQY